MRCCSASACTSPVLWLYFRVSSCQAHHPSGCVLRQQVLHAIDVGSHEALDAAAARTGSPVCVNAPSESKMALLNDNVVQMCYRIQVDVFRKVHRFCRARLTIQVDATSGLEGKRSCTPLMYAAMKLWMRLLERGPVQKSYARSPSAKQDTHSHMCPELPTTWIMSQLALTSTCTPNSKPILESRGYPGCCC